MSDFDKEAEREKLREKYESEEDDREVAEKMSELLLQGATMTNAHCSECGDPIFRYDGQEFCATCEKAVNRDAGDDEQADGEDSENIEVTTPDENARVAFGGESNQQTSGQHGQDGNETDQQTEQTQSQQAPTQQSPQNQQSAQPQQAASESRSQVEQSREVSGVEPTAGGDVGAARQSLERTLARFAQQAEATEDPQRASEYLAAAREAAETLAALRQ